MDWTMQPAPPPDAAEEVEFIRGLVARYFPVYETEISYDSVSFKVRADPLQLEEKFGLLESELSRNGYTPMISYEIGEHIIRVTKLPPRKFRSIWVNVLLLCITLVTTVLAGSFLWMGYSGDESGAYFTSESLLMGALTFALPLMAVLGIHEMGHYFMAKRHGVPASLPFFIPAPPPPLMFPLGTFGAFISIRSPIPNRKTLFDLGIGGPIAGFIATIPIAILGLMLTNSGARPLPEETGGLISLAMPVIYEIIGAFVPITGEYALHPTAVAGWVGFLVTAINLLPAGSLDGGHIARAALGANAKYISWIAVIILFVVGAIFYIGWMFFGLIILFLGMEHSPPLNDITPISNRRKIVGIAMAGILIISFALIPIQQVPPDYSFEAELIGSDQGNVSLNMSHTFVLLLTSTGNLNTDIEFDLQPGSAREKLGFSVSYLNESSGEYEIPEVPEAPVRVGSNLTVNFTISLAQQIPHDDLVDAQILMTAVDDPDTKRTISIYVLEIAGNYSYTIVPMSDTIGPGEIREFTINLTSNSSVSMDLELTAIVRSGWSAWIYVDDPVNASNRLDVTLEPMANISCTLVVEASSTSSPGDTVTVEVEIVPVGSADVEISEIVLTVV